MNMKKKADPENTINIIYFEIDTVLSFQANTQFYLRISDNLAHTESPENVFSLHPCSLHLIFEKGEENRSRKEINGGILFIMLGQLLLVQ